MVRKPRSKKPDYGSSLFCIEDSHRVLEMELLDAKNFLILRVSGSTANVKNKTQITKLIIDCLSVQQLSFVIVNHILAHPSEGLKVI